MFKPLTQTLADRFGGSPMSPEVDPETVARSFGVAYPVGEPLPENEVPVHHIAVAPDSNLFLDGLKSPTPKPEPKSLYTLAVARLNSIKPRTKERADEVAQAIANLAEPFQKVDALVSTLEQEHREAIKARWEELRVRGRALAEKIATTLLANVHKAMMNGNAAREKRGKISTLVETSFQEMRGILRNKFSSEEEIASVEERLANFKKASEAARLEVLEADRGLAEQQNTLALAKSELLGIKTAMDQCSAELKGVSYHDPELGLSVDPKSYQESW